MIRPEIATAIEETIAPAMRRMGYQGLRIEEGENHAGEPVIRVHVGYAAEGDPIDSKVTADLVYRLRVRLLELGEERFPHIRHHFDERQKVLGYV
jgi:hypothetical protein